MNLVHVMEERISSFTKIFDAESSEDGRKDVVGPSR